MRPRFFPQDDLQSTFLCLPKNTQQWLLYQGSLTQQLYKLQKKILLKVIADTPSVTPDISAQNALHLQPSEKARAREVVWEWDQKAIIEATVIIPQTSITQETYELTLVNENPIGLILFSDPTLQRSEFTFYMKKTNWVRESIFIFKGKPLLIRELFRPLFFDIIAQISVD